MRATQAIARSGPGRFFREVREGARRQRNVVFALIFKEFKNRTEKAERAGMVWVVLEPAFTILIFAVFWYFIRRPEVDGVHIAIFIAVATPPYFIVRRSIAQIPRSMKSNWSLYSFSQVKPIDSVIARFTLDMSLLLVGTALVFFLLWWFLGLSIRPDYLLQLSLIVLLALAMGFGLCLVIATYGMLHEFVFKLIGMFSRGSLLVSAVFYTPSDLPTPARQLLSWNPVVHLVEYARYYAFGLKLFPEASMLYPVVFAAGALFLGFTCYFANRFNLIERR